MLTRIDPGPTFSQAVVWKDTVSVSGQIALSSPGASFQEQFSEVLRRTETVLALADSSPALLISATVVLVDRGDLQLMNQLWSSWVPDGKAPARLTFVAALVAPEYLVELAVVAATRGS